MSGLELGVLIAMTLTFLVALYLGRPKALQPEGPFKLRKHVWVGGDGVRSEFTITNEFHDVDVFVQVHVFDPLNGWNVRPSPVSITAETITVRLAAAEEPDRIRILVHN